MRYAATLALGLREESRVRTALSGTKAPRETLMLARLIDDVSFIAWTKTKAAEKNRDRPPSILESLMHGNSNRGNIKRFASAEEFEAARAEALKGAR